MFVVKWDVGRLPRDIYLRDPTGVTSIPTPTQADGLHKLYRIAAPAPGEWTVILDAEVPGLVASSAPASEPSEVLVEASVSSNLALDVFLGLPVEQRLVGKPMPIYASLADALSIPGAAVNAAIAGPLGAYDVTLYDDGAHGDGGPNDGFYGGIFYETHGHGAYDMVVTATGRDSHGQLFTRRQRMGFNMLESRFLDYDPRFPGYNPNHAVNWNDPADPNRGRIDTDNDGLIDWWERETGLDRDNTIPDQRLGDPDYDGVTSGEEFQLGTDPLASDTDHGGEIDKSEVTSRSNPLDPADDQILCPLSFSAGPTLSMGDDAIYTGAAILMYEVMPGHSRFSLWRQAEGGPRKLISDELPATGVYSDTNVSEGTTYQYWLAAQDAKGRTSCVLGPSRVKLDPDAPRPEGSVDINDGAAQTNTPHVKLGIGATADAVEMQVRNPSRGFNDTEGWEPYQTTKDWTLEPDGGIGVVFVRFRDAAGNISEPAVDIIAVGSNSQSLFLPLVQRR